VEKKEGLVMLMVLLGKLIFSSDVAHGRVFQADVACFDKVVCTFLRKKRTKNKVENGE
jgi:hypothetical protein